MAEPLKNQLNLELLKPIVTFIKQLNQNFNDTQFLSLTFDEQWANLALKQRYRKISNSFKKTLPADYTIAVQMLATASQKFTGFETLFFPDFIEAYGWQNPQNFKDSMRAIEQMTAGSSAEFAIRPFITHYPEKTFRQLRIWTSSNNHHLRRLVSEGTRPKLPWASQLHALIKDPYPNITLLEILKQDASKYVQKSVANHLNDISKDHPNKVLSICKDWQGLSPQTDWIIKHACRTLLKSAHPTAMQLFGYRNPSKLIVSTFQCDQQVKQGENLDFSFRLTEEEPKKRIGKTRIEYAIDFMKNNGKQNRKIFKIGESDYQQPQKKINKSFSFKAISTRKYYTGEHRLIILINGQEKGVKTFYLI